MIFKKLLASYLLIILIPLFVLSLMISSITARMINDEIGKSAGSIVDQASQNVSDLLKNLKGAALLLSKNDSVQDGLARVPRSEEELAAQINNMRNALLNNGVYYQKYSSIQLYALNGGSYAPLNTPNDIMSRQLVEDREWFRETVDRKGKLYWNVSHEFGSSQINVNKVIYDLKDYRRPIGVISVSADLSKLEMILSGTKIGKSGTLNLIDGEGNSVYPLNAGLGLPEDLSFDRDSGIKYLSIDGSDTMFIYSRLSETDWKVVSLIPVNSLFEKTVALKRTICLIAVVSVFVAVILSLALSLRISKPIIRLAETMEEVKNGNLDLHAETPLKGEVGMLYSNFNNMIRMIKLLIQDVYVTKIRQKDAEIKALEAQINPHFLYNTLDAINWMAKTYRAEDISKMATSLASLLRYSISKGEEVIEIEKEIRQVECYLTIQKIRFANRFESYFNLDEKILGVKIIRLILQPLVENAIIHGLANAPENSYLIVNGYQEEGHVVFEIINNGVPVDVDKVADILREEGDHKGHGIRNVDQRLRLTYGDCYGVAYRVEGRETIASIRIPHDKTA